MVHFIAGAVVGAVAMVAFNNSKEMKQNVNKGLDKVKDFTCDLKTTLSEKLECIKSKKEDEAQNEVASS